MTKLWRALFCALLVLTLLQNTNCGKYGGRGGGFSSGRHSYPSSGGLSGSGSRGHGYPSSGGGHGYPSSGGLSGSGGSHGYPSSGGLSGTGSRGGQGYPSSGGSHGYPSSGGLSGSGTGAKYPSSGGGLSGGGTQSHTYPGSRPNTGNTHHTTVINHNYHYSPPQQIRYAAPGQASHSYPVYHGTPPTYVYQYKNSDSKYGTLLAGLALLNLGTLGASVYAASKAGQGGNSGSGSYKPQPGEYCKFGVKKDNGDYEETRIDCNLITSFIYQEQTTPQQSGGTNSTVITTSVTNVTVVNMTNGVPDTPQTTTQPPNVLYQMLPNGTLVPVNVTLPNTGAVNATVNGTDSNGTMTSSVVVTTTTTNTTVTNALDVKGEAIKVTPGMQCFVIRHTPVNDMKKTVPCGLLQSYADQSIKKKNSSTRNLPTFTVLCAMVAFVFY